MSFRRRASFLLDRTAVLALGVIAGFAIGLSFHGGSGGVIGDSPVPVVLPPPARPVPGRPAPAPELTGAVDTQVTARVRDGGLVRVGVFGDSFGDGVWAALYHQLPGKQRFKVLRFSKEGTGFTRYRQLDLEQRARGQVAGEPIDVAVICFGANDVQPIFADGHLRALLDAGWQKTIGERVDRFVAVARSTGARVYWVGLPVMRDPAMDGNIRAMDAFFQARAEALGVPYIDTRAASVDEKGGFAPYLPDSRTGEPRLMRAGDGVHMTMLGYERLTTGLAQRIRDYAASVRHRAGVPDPTPSPTPTQTPSPTPTPTLHRAEPTPDHATAAANRREKREERTEEQSSTKPDGKHRDRSDEPAPVIRHPRGRPASDDDTPRPARDDRKAKGGKHRHLADDAPAAHDPR